MNFEFCLNLLHLINHSGIVLQYQLQKLKKTQKKRKNDGIFILQFDTNIQLPSTLMASPTSCEYSNPQVVLEEALRTYFP